MKNKSITVIFCISAVISSAAVADCPTNFMEGIEDGAWNVDIDISGRQWSAIGPGGAIKTAAVTVICTGDIVQMQQSGASDRNDCTYNLRLNSRNNTVSGAYHCSMIQPRPGMGFTGKFK